MPREDLNGLSQPTQERIQDMNRFNGTSGEMPVSQTEQYFPKREVPRDKNVEGDDLNALKEMLAGLFNPDKAAPYETVRQNSDGGYAVGRYGFTYPLLEGLMEALGDPPDPQLIDALVKAGKLPKAFADKLKNPEFFKKFHDFVDKLKGGQGEISKKELEEFLPKDVQESLAALVVEQAKAQVGSKPGDVAAAVFSGKALSQVDAQDLNTAKAKQIEDAGNRLYLLADARQHQKQPDEKVHWNKEGLVSIGDGKFLSADAAQALNRANQQMEAAGKGHVIVNSGFRDIHEQAELYAKWHGIKPVAKPGTSNHEKGMAIDVHNWEKAKPFLLANGFVHGDGRGPLKNDLVHFKYVGGNESTA